METEAAPAASAPAFRPFWFLEWEGKNFRKEGRLFPPGFEPGTFRVWGERDNRYTTETRRVLPPSGTSLKSVGPATTLLVANFLNCRMNLEAPRSLRQADCGFREALLSGFLAWPEGRTPEPPTVGLRAPAPTAESSDPRLCPRVQGSPPLLTPQLPEAAGAGGSGKCPLGLRGKGREFGSFQWASLSLERILWVLAACPQSLQTEFLSSRLDWVVFRVNASLLQTLRHTWRRKSTTPR